MDEPRRRQVEVFSAGCRVCDETNRLVEQLAGDQDDVKLLDTREPEVVQLAINLGVRSVPAVVITASKLAACCRAGAGPDAATLKEAGIGSPIREEGRKRIVEVFSAGCSMCREAVELVQQMACRSCDVRVVETTDENAVRLAKSLGIRSVPAVVITTSELAACCRVRGPDEATLRQEGLGQPIQLVERR